MRDAYPKFEEAGIALYAISYDDREALAEFGKHQKIPYPLLSDADSRAIRDFGILNLEASRGDAFLEGLPYPGVYVTDERGEVTAKFFHGSHQRRDSPEMFIDAALGRVTFSMDEFAATGGDEEEVRISSFVRGGNGKLRFGMRRQLITRFELGPGTHIYGQPVPEGMVPATVSVSSTSQLVFEEPIYPSTEPLRLESMGMTLPVWSGLIDVIIPFYADSSFGDPSADFNSGSVELTVSVRYQACDDEVCFLPKTESFTIQIELDALDVPNIDAETREGHVANFDGNPHLRRLIERKLAAKSHDADQPADS